MTKEYKMYEKDSRAIWYDRSIRFWTLYDRTSIITDYTTEKKVAHYWLETGKFK